MSRLKTGQDGLHQTYCRICDAQCGLVVTVADGAVKKIAPDFANISSRGHVCRKGVSFSEVINDPMRLTRPMKRTGGPGEFEPVSWDEALSDIAARLSAIIDRNGPGAFACYLGNPPAYSSLNLLYASGFLAACGSDKLYSASCLDTNAQLRANELLFGRPFPFVLPDLPNNDVLFIFGSNPLVSNGSVMVTPRIKDDLDAIHRRGKVVVFDPRRTETAASYEHVAIAPGGDPWLLLAMIKIVIDEGAVDHDAIAARTTGYERLMELVRDIDLEDAASRCRIPLDQIRELALLFARTPRAATYGRVGIGRNPFGTLSNALHNVFSIVCGKFGQPGGNGFGLQIMQTETHAASDASDAEPVRSRIGGFRAPSGHLSAPMLAPDITEPGEGQVRAFFTFGSNPVLGAPNGDQLSEALQQLDLFFALDLYQNETNRFADYILPCATFLERQDVNTGTVSLMIRPALHVAPPVVEPRGEAREEQEILFELCARMGLESPLPMIKLPDMGHVYDHDTIIDMMLRFSNIGDQYGARPDGLTMARLIEEFPSGYALPQDNVLSSTFEQVLHADRRIHLCDDVLAAEIARLKAHPAEDSAQFKLIGRRDIRAMNSWMHNAPRLSRSLSPTLRMHPDDARAIGVQHGDTAIVKSKAGRIVVDVEISDEMMTGVVSYPHGFGHDPSGWPQAGAVGGANVNALASTAMEDIEVESGSPYLDGIPVEIRLAEPRSAAMPDSRAA